MRCLAAIMPNMHRTVQTLMDGDVSQNCIRRSNWYIANTIIVSTVHLYPSLYRKGFHAGRELYPKSPASFRCLDVRETSPTMTPLRGYRVIHMPCDSGRTSQVWSWHRRGNLESQFRIQLRIQLRIQNVLTTMCMFRQSGVLWVVSCDDIVKSGLANGFFYRNIDCVK